MPSSMVYLNARKYREIDGFAEAEDLTVPLLIKRIVLEWLAKQEPKT